MNKKNMNMSSSNDDNDDDDKHGGGSGEMISSKKVCTSCEQNYIDNITEGIDSMALLNDNMSTCANCGKEGNSDDMNTCNKCKMVKYCNAACKKKHRTKHKKKCERRVVELHEEQLFQQELPPREECSICFLPHPIDESQMQFQTCCGKIVCDGCIYAIWKSEGKDLCAFCRTPPVSSKEETVKRLEKLMDKDNGEAINALGSLYRSGDYGLAQDYQKANELYLKAGELGCAAAYYNLGTNYDNGRGVEIDKKKTEHFYELAI